MLVAAILPVAAAFAHAPSGLGMAVVGGSLSTPGGDGAQGLAMNPAAARSDRPELLLDLGEYRYHFGYKIQGNKVEDSRSGVAMPYLAAALPLGPVGLGFTGMVPYARAGSSEPVGTQRFHTIEGRVVLFEGDISLAWQAHPRLALGAGLLAGRATYGSKVAMDTGVLLNQLMGPGGDAPVGDPFLEGTRTIDKAVGNAFGLSLGVRWEPLDAWCVSAGYRSPMRTSVKGGMELYPSNDLVMVLEGDLVGDFAFPPEAFLSVGFPAGPVSMEVDLGWIGWSATAVSKLHVDNLRLVSDDPILAAVLESYGLSDPAMLGSLETVGLYGLHDIVTGGVSGTAPIRGPWGLLAGAWYAPASIEDGYMAPGNFDYDSLDTRLALTWESRGGSMVGLSADWIPHRTRDITHTVYSWDNDPEVDPALPPVNGKYWFNLFRLGVSAVLRGKAPSSGG